MFRDLFRDLPATCGNAEKTSKNENERRKMNGKIKKARHAQGARRAQAKMNKQSISQDERFDKSFYHFCIGMIIGVVCLELAPMVRLIVHDIWGVYL